ncbi:hypothetical protein EW026_g5664 [Hermanssonia centrifuga]|uniref:DNA 3'-5' helicase n=2 Tax=Hermanssonia centrifuga TaxID=98765 RepID=A0A4V3X9Z5_9APHY|nr:hypothetical protein EW026_g5664 [Hermanssonia centrifuga]
MPLLADKTNKKKVIIVSTLDELEADQAQRFKQMGLTATPVNSQVWTKDLHKDIMQNKYRVLLTSPEMLLEHPEFSKLIRSSDFMQDVALIVIDEAHCISQWGADFRVKFGELEKLRSYIALDVPILATSATLTPTVLAEIQQKLSYSTDKTYLLDLGNDRHNITPIVSRMKSAKDLTALDFVLDEALCEPRQPLVRTLIYKRAMRRFRNGDIKILCATEVAGMGLDIPDIDRVVQYMLPKTLNEWVQHYGRAGRGGQPAMGILLVEPSAFKKIKVKKQVSDASKPTNKRKVPDVPVESDSEDPNENDLECDEMADDGAETTNHDSVSQYQKKVEPGLREYLEALECRREIQDKYFRNPTRLREYTDKKPAIKKKSGEGNRRGERLQSCRDALFHWRRRQWKNTYSKCIWGVESLLPDKILKQLAKAAHIRTMDDIKREIPDWIWVDDHGEDVIARLRPIDEQWNTERLEAAEENKAKRRRTSEENKNVRDEARREQKYMATLRKNNIHNNPNISRAPLGFAIAPQQMTTHPTGLQWMLYATSSTFAMPLASIQLQWMPVNSDLYGSLQD